MGLLRDCSGEAPEIMRLQKQSGPGSAALGCAPRGLEDFDALQDINPVLPRDSLGFFLSPTRT